MPLDRATPRPTPTHRPAAPAWALWLACACALLALAVGCGTRRPPPPATRAEAELAAADAYTAALLRRQAADPSALTKDEVIALGYLERLRLGLGSPFRLAAYALRDPRLLPPARARTAAMLLQATRQGRAYAVDPGALARVGADARGRTPAAATAHLGLIAAAVEGADDPRSGELAVRAAYLLAAAEGVVSPEAPALAAHAAALVRDRELARRDVERLVESAGAAGRSAVSLVPAWRATRFFEVESPPGAPLPAHLETAGLERALRYAAGLRALSPPPEPGAWAPEPPLLAPATARRLGTLARKEARPPRAPLRVTLDRHRDAVLREAGGGRESLQRLLGSGADEERFAAEHARLPAAARTPALGRAVAEAAVAMRTLAQEKPWLPGDPAPTAAELNRRHGIAGVEFDAGIPAAWRPYYRHLLDGALADLRTVLPTFGVRGLAFRVGATGRQGAALAIHDPRGRVIRLPPSTGPGTLAHELAHDLDWQVARARYGRRGTYGTDLALHAPGADRFAAAVRALPAAPVSGAPVEPHLQRYEGRPAEKFARLFDGWAATALAARGRSNGHLSVFQDDVLAGHGTALAPGARGPATEGFLPLLATAARLHPAAERELHALWGPGRPPRPLAAVAPIVGVEPVAVRRRVPRSLAEPPSLPEGVLSRVAEVESRRSDALRERAALLCASPLLARDPRGERAFRRLVDAAADARIRALLRPNARALGLSPDALAAMVRRPASPPAPGPCAARRDAGWWGWPLAGRAGTALTLPGVPHPRAATMEIRIAARINP